MTETCSPDKWARARNNRAHKRICAFTRCDTILSVYNNGTLCSVHEQYIHQQPRSSVYVKRAK